AGVRARAHERAVRGPPDHLSRRSGAGNGAATNLAHAAERSRKVSEELLGKFAGAAVDEPAPELGDLATDLRVDVVIEPRCSALGIRQPHVGSALGEAGDAALALAGDAVAVRRIDVGEVDLAFETCAHRPDFHLDGGLKLRVGELLEALATGNGGPQRVGIV